MGGFRLGHIEYRCLWNIQGATGFVDFALGKE
jgi:hypothetical protein